MERNSAGQVIVKESGSLLLSIPCITSTISINAYNRFLLDEKEFTELVVTVDKDALITNLANSLNSALNTIDILNFNASSSITGSTGTGTGRGTGTGTGGGTGGGSRPPGGGGTGPRQRL